MSEVIKLVICFFIYLQEERRTSLVTPRKVFNDIFGPESGWLKMTVPAVLYFIQNNLQYVAVTLLDAATFQVTYQMKIITTALFSVWMLNRSLSVTKWVSLVLLTVGIALVQISDGKARSSSNGDSVGGRLLGLVAVTVACVLSGLAGVWYAPNLL
jgi:solute carrier family 35 (UDP-sugar transporter), member A1/2/3